MFVFVRRPKSGGKEPVLLEKTISENGEYLAESDNADGYSKVTVNVQSQSKLQQVIDRTVTEITADDLEGATRIGQYSFRYCNNLKSIAIPNSVEAIQLYACANCNALREVEIGTGITLIDNAVFENSLSLTKLTIHATTPPRLLSAGMFTIYINIYVPAESVEAYKAATNWSALASYIQAIPV